MTRRRFRPFVLGFALVSMFAAQLLRAQTSRRPEAYSLTMISPFAQTSEELFRHGLNANASEAVTVGTPSSQPNAAPSALSASPQAATPEPANLLTNGDFESGNTGFTTGYTYGNVSGPAAYWIGPNASQAPGAYGDWYHGGDHTTGTGNMLVVNGANSATTPVWEEVVPVTPNTTYTFSYWGAEVDHDSNSLPHLQLKINGRYVGSNYIEANSPDNGGSWKNFTFTWNSGSSRRADLALFDLNTDTPWNDFALDDISFGAQLSASPQAATPEPANLLTNGDFESGNTGFTTGYTYGNVSGPAAYWIGPNASQAPGAYGDWYHGGDHTTGTGNMLVGNGANSATTPVWEEVVPVTPNTTYTFSYWGAEVDHDSNSLPHLQLKINGRYVGSNYIEANSPDNGGSWKNFAFTWNSGSSRRADLALFDLNTDTPWNDFALDDISFGARPSR